jgi:hypothetical protein
MSNHYVVVIAHLLRDLWLVISFLKTAQLRIKVRGWQVRGDKGVYPYQAEYRRKFMLKWRDRISVKTNFSCLFQEAKNNNTYLKKYC